MGAFAAGMAFRRGAGPQALPLVTFGKQCIQQFWLTGPFPGKPSGWTPATANPRHRWAPGWCPPWLTPRWGTPEKDLAPHHAHQRTIAEYILRILGVMAAYHGDTAGHEFTEIIPHRTKHPKLGRFETGVVFGHGHAAGRRCCRQHRFYPGPWHCPRHWPHCREPRWWHRR